MTADENSTPTANRGEQWFASTHWSAVLAAGQSDTRAQAAAKAE